MSANLWIQYYISHPLCSCTYLKKPSKKLSCDEFTQNELIAVAKAYDKKSVSKVQLLVLAVETNFSELPDLRTIKTYANPTRISGAMCYSEIWKFGEVRSFGVGLAQKYER